MPDLARINPEMGGSLIPIVVYRDGDGLFECEYLNLAKVLAIDSARRVSADNP